MSRRRRLTSLAAAAAVACAIAGTAVASFGSSASAAHSVATGTLAAATGLTAADGGCTLLVPRISLSWTASTSTFAAGYEIFRSTTSGGPYASVATVTGAATTTYLDTGLALNTTYYYVVKTTRNAWRSADSNQASRKTPTLCA